MQADLREAMEKLAWLELYVPVGGATKRLAERAIRRSVRTAVAPAGTAAPSDADKRPPLQTPVTNTVLPAGTPAPANYVEPARVTIPAVNTAPQEADVPATHSFSAKLASFKMKYEGRL